MNTNTHEYRPMFLFGSYTSPMPKVKDITKQILSGELEFGSNHRLQTNLGFEGVMDPHSAELTKATLNAITSVLSEQPSKNTKTPPNYEELAQIVDDLCKNEGTHRTPTLIPFRNLVFEDLLKKLNASDSLKKYIGPIRDRSVSRWDILNATNDWIRWNVYESLIDRNKEHTNKVLLERNGEDIVNGQINFLRTLNCDKRLFSLSTLNHDIKSESALKTLGIHYEDGFYFDESIQTSRFHPSKLNDNDQNILLKLHGSIDWCWNGEEYHRLDNPDSDYSEGNHNLGYYGTPDFLAGILGKMEAYNYANYPWIWAKFQNQLLQTRRIICSGYGFMDLGVTNRLSGWLSYIDGAQILILDPDPESLIEKCQSHSISNISSFFGCRETPLKYTICEKSSEIENIEHPIILLKCGFEDASEHAEALRKFAYFSS
ncbi:MAG: SIR2 family protein [Opitutales bacterium]|jgi:hypothetical protein|nr:SIR2 family protein [Opitutales bacterium]MDP4644128.1 SIR2 family protein [Opitutales bacterium]MDP4778574.1 SIR2 family protein [Opitutales bacterium]MDP4883798.1 SIR2 family protein [Opitutales bacterium]MDP5080855.1 SIR2 family protein [Opitutales bacterium]